MRWRVLFWGFIAFTNNRHCKLKPKMRSWITRTIMCLQLLSKTFPWEITKVMNETGEVRNSVYTEIQENKKIRKKQKKTKNEWKPPGLVKGLLLRNEEHSYFDKSHTSWSAIFRVRQHDPFLADVMVVLLVCLHQKENTFETWWQSSCSSSLSMPFSYLLA